MSDDTAISLEALEREESRLRERLAKIALVKNLLSELALPESPAGRPQAQSENRTSTAPDSPVTPAGRVPAFDGTFQGLVSVYRKDERSNYHQLKQKVRVNYDSAFKRLIKDVGSERVAEWSAGRVKAIYDQSWAADGKLAMGRGMVAKLRLLCSYGSTVLNDDACTRLGAILSNMRIPIAKSNNERMSREQARAIRVAAREHFGWNSIALAQAFQFEFPKLRQVDVIGEWVPLSEGPDSDVRRDGQKWVHGLQWSDIDENLVLKKTLTSGRRNEQRTIEFSLNRSQMVREEINRVPEERRKGPMVICEFNNQPWSTNEFRRKWRIVADKAGVPKNVKNMDSRQDTVPTDYPRGDSA
jgi:hypothetical protein